jgi:aryl-alcohol dehydrogenase-like predicted oxidoreductase
MAVSATPDDEKYFHGNVSTEELEPALRLTPIASVQNRCNPFEKRDFKNGLMELCAQRGITYIPHSPVGGHHSYVCLSQHSFLRQLSEKHGASPYRIALAWFLHKGPHIIPVPGASKVISVRDSAEVGSALFRLHLKIVILRSVQATADDEQGLSC